MSFLFEEVDVIEEEIEPSYDPSLSQEEPQQSKIKMIDLQEEDPIIEEVPLISQKSLKLDEIGVSPKVEIKPSGRSSQTSHEQYKPQGIISPIFGKKEQVITSTKVSQPPLPLPQEKDSVLGTVFSPIYGSIKPQVQSKKTAISSAKHVSMEDLFSDEVIHPKVEQPQLDALFDADQKETTVARQSSHHDEHHDDEGVHLMFRSLFDEQE